MESRFLSVAFLGNFSVPYSSECHHAASLEALGCRVTRIQEGEVRATEVPTLVKAVSADLFVWVQTYGLAVSGGTIEERAQMVDDIKAMGVPTVGYHLDLWLGLNRADQIPVEPYFRMDHFFSTDGGHDQEWIDAGINHHWLPPGVYHAEAYDGVFTRVYASDVAFVGSHKHYGHEEHWHIRRAMLQQLRRKYRDRMNFWPRDVAVRGKALNDLYASVKVVIGDSCLAGKVHGYWSDRVSECTGRGGFLIHPYIGGIHEVHPDLVTFQPGNWDEMIEKVDYYLTHDEERELLRKKNAEHTRANHTYLHRWQTILETVL